MTINPWILIYDFGDQALNIQTLWGLLKLLSRWKQLIENFKDKKVLWWRSKELGAGVTLEQAKPPPQEGHSTCECRFQSFLLCSDSHSAHVPWRQWKVVQVLAPLPPCGRPGCSFWLLALAWPRPSYYSHLGSQTVDGWCLSLCLSDKQTFFRKWRIGKIGNVFEE